MLRPSALAGGRFRFGLALAGALAAPAPPALGGEPSFFGSSGLLGVPTAEVLPEGAGTAGFNRYNPNPVAFGEGESYFFGVGFLPGLEGVIRLVDTGFPNGLNDLSADAKYQFWAAGKGPRLALGVQDFGGEFRFFRSEYGVATWPWRQFSATLGYGVGDTLDGVFGGLEWKPLPYVSVLADHNAADFNAGLRLSSGAGLKRWQAQLTAAYSGASEGFEGGIALRFPLGVNDRASRYARQQAPPPVVPATAVSAPVTAAAPVTTSDTALEALAEALVRLGFESVRVGLRPDGTVIAVVENRVFNHSFVDAAGAALGAAFVHTGATATMLEVVLTAYEVPQLAVTVPAAVYGDFLARGDAAALRRAWRVRHVDAIPAPHEADWLRTKAPMHSLELVLEPLLRTFVGTDFGALDYALGLRLSAVQPLAPGLLLTSGYQLPATESSDFRRGGVFENFAPELGLDHFLLQYFHKPGARWAWLWSGGVTQIFQADLRVAALEQLWLSERGRHQLRAKLMWLGSRANPREVALAGYNWFDARRRYSAAVTLGRFYAGESGLRLNVNRWFGDTQFGVYWRYENRSSQLAGFELSLPLTPRRDMAPRGVQIKGSRRWAYGLGSTLNAADRRNPLRPGFMLEPQLDLDLRRDFFDSGRLNPDQLDANVKRLRGVCATQGTGCQ